jgi:fatty-acyl-CoA synthase
VISTMGNEPLTILGILRHGQRIHGGSHVVTYDGDAVSERSFGDVAGSAEALAGALADLGVQPGDRVATLCWNHTEHLVAYLAVPCMGAVLLTLNLRLSPAQLAYVAADAAPRVLIADAALLSTAAPLLAGSTSIEAVIVLGDAPARSDGPDHLRYEDLVAHGASFIWPELGEQTAAVMCYTTGTTGAPKGVAYSHRSTFLHSLAICTPNVFSIGEADRVLAVVPMYHATAWGIPYAGWFMGADLLMPGRYLQGEHLARFAEMSAATFTAAVPSVLSDMLRAAVAAQRDLSALRLVVGGGSAVPGGLIDRWQQELGVPLVQAWGMTETSPVAAIARPPAGADPADDSWKAKTGRPVPGVELRVVGDDGQAVPPDGCTVGELQARGPWVTTSYYREAAPDKFDDGWLRTGDVGHIDGRNYVQLTDRAKDVIKSGGEWISSVELENLLASHPRVAEAAVIGVHDDRWQERPLACVVFEQSPDAAAASAFPELRSYLEKLVPRWWVPERWAQLRELPRTSVGKLDKARLRDQYASNELTVTLVVPVPGDSTPGRS